MKTKSLLLIASIVLALAAGSAAHAQVYVRAAVVARPAYYGHVVYAYPYAVPPAVVTVPAPVPAAPAVVYAAPAPAVVVAPRVYWGGWYGWGPRYVGRGYWGRGWRR